MSKTKTVIVDDVKYICADESVKLAEEVDGLKYCVIRTYSAGVHIGFVEQFGSDK